jgi:hypothetical protein
VNKEARLREVRAAARDSAWSGLSRRLRAEAPGLVAKYRRLAPWVYVAAAGVLFAIFAPDALNADSRAYFRAASDPSTMYSQHAVDMPGSYMYAPAFAQLLAPLDRLGWGVFYAAWYVLTAAALWWLAREWSPIVLFVPVVYLWSPPPLYLPVAMELRVGNIQLLLSVAFALSFRWPALWSLPLLTKPTLGVGLIWYVVRREWRNLAIALGATAAITLVSVVLAPGLWHDWLAVLADNANTASPNAFDAPFWFLPLLPRLVVAAGLIAWGARSNRRWTLIVGTLLAVPVLWRTAPVMLLGLLGLLRVAPPQRPGQAPPVGHEGTHRCSEPPSCHRPWPG